MSTIFISYRQSDTPGEARSLFDTLTTRFPGVDIYFDVEEPQVGMDFVSRFQAVVPKSAAVVVLIGPKWTQMKDRAGRRRLEREDDYVRLELTGALTANVPLIPVLIQGAEMPREDELPDVLKPLAHRTAVVLRHDRWNADVENVISSLQVPLQRIAVGSAQWKRIRLTGQALTWAPTFLSTGAIAWLVKQGWFNLVSWADFPSAALARLWVAALVLAVMLAPIGLGLGLQASVKGRRGLFSLGDVGMRLPPGLSLPRLSVLWVLAAVLLIVAATIPPPVSLTVVEEPIGEYLQRGYTETIPEFSPENYQLQRRSHYVVTVRAGRFNPAGDYTMKWRFATPPLGGIELAHRLVDSNFASQFKFPDEYDLNNRSTPVYVFAAPVEALRAPKPIRFAGMYYILNRQIEEFPLEVSIQAPHSRALTLVVSPRLDPRTWR